jgi:hypothetical protein
MRCYFIDVAESGFLDGGVLDDFTEDTTVSTTNDEHFLWIGVGIHGKVSNHLLVPKIISIQSRTYENSSRSVA